MTTNSADTPHLTQSAPNLFSYQHLFLLKIPHSSKLEKGEFISDLAQEIKRGMRGKSSGHLLLQTTRQWRFAANGSFLLFYEFLSKKGGQKIEERMLSLELEQGWALFGSYFDNNCEGLKSLLDDRSSETSQTIREWDGHSFVRGFHCV